MTAGTGAGPRPVSLSAGGDRVETRTLALWAHPDCSTLETAAAELGAELRDAGMTVAVVAGLGPGLDREAFSSLAETVLVYTPEEFAAFPEDAARGVVDLLRRRHSAVLVVAAVPGGGPPEAWVPAVENHLLLVPAHPEPLPEVQAWLDAWRRASRSLPHLLVEPREPGPEPQAVANLYGLELMGSTGETGPETREERRARNRERIRRVIEADRAEARADTPPPPGDVELPPQLLQDLVRTVEVLAALGQRRKAVERSTEEARQEFERLRAAMLGAIDSDEDPVDGIMEEQVRALVQAKIRLRAARRERAQIVNEIREPAARLREWLDSVAAEAG